MNNSRLASLTDRLDIIEKINRFGLSIDLRDWDSFRSLFANAVEFDYSSIGEVAGTLSPDEIASTARQDLGSFRATQHAITNHYVQLSGNEATCYAHVRAQHFLPNDSGESLLEIGGYYTATLRRADPDWKISRWVFSVLWTRGDRQLFETAKQIVKSSSAVGQ